MSSESINSELSSEISNKDQPHLVLTEVETTQDKTLTDMSLTSENKESCSSITEDFVQDDGECSAVVKEGEQEQESNSLEEISPIISVVSVQENQQELESKQKCLGTTDNCENKTGKQLQVDSVMQEKEKDGVITLPSESSFRTAQQLTQLGNNTETDINIGRRQSQEQDSVIEICSNFGINASQPSTESNMDMGRKPSDGTEVIDEVIINEDSSQSTDDKLIAEPIFIKHSDNPVEAVSDVVVDLTAESYEATAAECISIDSNGEEEAGEPAKKRQKVESEVIELSEESADAVILVASSESSPSSVYNFNSQLKELTGAWQCYKNKDSSNFLKGCKWAPDGTCLMTNSDDNVIRVFNLPEQLYHQGGEDADLQEMVPVLSMKEADTVYDYCWFPLMSSSNPDTACLAVTSKDTPVHLYDAFTGDIRCTYRAYDHLDEIAAAHSVSFDVFGNKLFCGFNKMIRVFDVNRPGRQFQERPTYAKEGQRGIISCIVHSPTEHGLYAAGSYSRSIALYQDTGKGEMLCMFEGQQGGVTHLLFSPDGTKLYSGGRKDNEILCWDLRSPGHILYTMIRDVQTNQRMYIDITSDGRYLVSGNHFGSILVWDTQQAPGVPGAQMDPVLQPIKSFNAHRDTVNGLSLHPTLPLIATASGQRHFPGYKCGSDLESGSDEDSNDNVDNSLRLWWLYPDNT